jgi:hypothetical protein
LHTSRIYKWDLCAPNAIISSLNGKLTDINGSFIDFSHRSNVKAVNGVIAAINDFDYYFKTFVGKEI